MNVNYKATCVAVSLLSLFAFEAAGKVGHISNPDATLTFVYSAADGLQTPLLRLYHPVVRQLDKGSEVKVEYDMLVGKKKHCSNVYEQSSFLLADGDTLLVREYTDGVAWKKKGASGIEMIDPSHSWLQKWTDCYEEFFPQDPQQTPGNRIGYPALFEFPGGVFALLSESGITPQEAGVSMHAKGENRFDLIPDGPEEGGWQTLIAGSLADVVESTLIHDNSAPAPEGDFSWIQPGVAAWVYWAYNHGSNDYEIIKKYSDLAAALKLPYVLIDAEWDQMKDGKTIKDAVGYAISKGIKPMIWYNSSVGWVDGAPTPKYRLNTAADLEKEFQWCEDIGVKGVKIDFFSGDTNLNMRFMAELLEAGLRHGLLVNFHGAPMLRGWQRTYPNLITTEAVYGAEWYNNLPVLTNRAAAHNATLPFTRNPVGSMDYTPCAFSDSQHPHITTHAHELALTSLFESGIQHIADRPESLLVQPLEVEQYFSELPTAWDDTVLIDGYPGEFVVMARRKDNKWWVAAINGTDSPMTIKDMDWSRLNLAGKQLKVRSFLDALPEMNVDWIIGDSNELPNSMDLLPRGGAVFVVDNSQNSI